MDSIHNDQSLNALPPGTQLGDYVIESELGSGGFSIVYLARHNLTVDDPERTWWVAIKEYLPAEVAGRGPDGLTIHPVKSDLREAFEDGLKRFKKEAQHLVRFRRLANVVGCLNLLEANGTAYLVMRYDDGLPLSTFLRLREEQGNPCTEGDLLAVMVPLLECLTDVHRAGVLHRDIKPGNIFVRREDDVTGRPAEPMLLDFGAAKHDYLGKHSRSGAPFTPGYAALEQTSSIDRMGPWTDIYALGALMWRMVAGGSGDERLYAPEDSADPPPGTWNPRPVDAQRRLAAMNWRPPRPDPMPSAMELGATRFSGHVLEAIDRCLALYPAERPQNCDELLELLSEEVIDSEEERNIIGIDLGTSYSRVSILDGDKVKVIENSEGKRNLPSVVAYTDEGEVLVGESAKRQAVTNPENTFFAVKRLLGQRFHDQAMRQDMGIVPFEIVRARNGDAWISTQGRQLAPPQVAAEVLKKLKRAAEDYLGEPATDATISVPAHFNEIQRQAITDAGRIAGLRVARIYNEPTLAALAYGLDRRPGDSTVAVCQLGSGNFGITIVEMAEIDGENQFEVLSTNGTRLGGEDFDLRIVDDLASAFKADTNIDLRADPPAMQRLKEAAENAKTELSSRHRTDINVPYIAADQSGPRHLIYQLTRKQLESLVEDLVDNTIEICRTAMVDAGVSIDDIDDVILVGGQTRMPMVRQKVKACFNREGRHSINPDESVAMGAAFMAAVLSGHNRDCLLLDVTPHSLGIEAKGGAMNTLIEKNTTFPTKRYKIFSVTTDDQKAGSVHILQGEHPQAAHNTSLGRIDLTEILKASRGARRVEVSFDVDANGTLHVSAEDEETSVKQRVAIKSPSGLSESEIRRMIDNG